VTGDHDAVMRLSPAYRAQRRVLAGSFGSGEGAISVAKVGSLSLENGSNISRTSQGLALETPTPA